MNKKTEGQHTPDEFEASLSTHCEFQNSLSYRVKTCLLKNKKPKTKT